MPSIFPCRSPFMFPKILLLTLPLLLAGCSSLSEEECRAMSWYNLGYQDGSRARPGPPPVTTSRPAVSTVSGWTKTSGRGLRQGLELYCIPELAYSKGREGHEYLGVCPNDTSFLTQFERGRQEYLLEQRLGELQQELERTEQDIYQLDQQIRSENDSSADYYRAQRERAIRHYEGCAGSTTDPLPGPGDPVLLRELTAKGSVWPLFCCRSGGQDPALQRQGDAVFVVIRGDPVRMGLDLGRRVAHGHRQPHLLEHVDVVVVVAKRHHILHGDPSLAAHRASRLPLLQPGCTSSTA